MRQSSHKTRIKFPCSIIWACCNLCCSFVAPVYCKLPRRVIIAIYLASRVHQDAGTSPDKLTYILSRTIFDRLFLSSQQTSRRKTLPLLKV